VQPMDYLPFHPLQPPNGPERPERHPSRREMWLGGAAGRAAPDSHSLRAGDQQRPHHDKRHQRPGPTPPQLLGERDEALVRAVALFHFLTAEQLTRLFYRPTSLEYVRAKLRRLTQAGYLLRLRLPRTTAGNPPFVYRLARGGLTFLAQSGDPTQVRFRPSEHQEHAYLFLAHTLAVNDVLIAATLASQELPQVILADVQHERDLRHTPVRVKTPQGESMGIVPDAWLDVHLWGKERMCLVLELDRGTIEQRAFTHKLRGLLAYAGGPYQEQFETASLTILIATTAGELRARKLVQWCERVLRQQHLEAEADLFLITALDPGAITPTRFFLSPIWQQPFEQTPRCLVDDRVHDGMNNP